MMKFLQYKYSIVDMAAFLLMITVTFESVHIYIYSYCLALNPYINFTIEKEADSKLPFLDLLIHRNSSSRFSFSI